MIDILVRVAAIVVTLLGMVLGVYAVITVGIDGRRRSEVWFWGAAAKMSRSSFAAYFGALGISVSLTAHIALFFRNQASFLPLIAAPAGIGFLLCTGWAYMLLRGNK